jgi:hypothetical protein
MKWYSKRDRSIEWKKKRAEVITLICSLIQNKKNSQFKSLRISSETPFASASGAESVINKNVGE